MKYIFLVVLILTNNVWAEDEHYQIAAEFEKLSSSINKEQMVNSMLPYIVQSNPEFSNKLPELKEFLVGIFTSEEYFDKKVRLYMSLYTKEELQLLVELAKSPAYTLLQEKRNDINVGLFNLTQELIVTKLPEFE